MGRTMREQLMHTQDVADTAAALMPDLDQDLEKLVGIPAVASPGCSAARRALRTAYGAVAAARIHAADGSVDPSEVEKVIVAQVVLLQLLADDRQTSSSGAAR
jgi:hypothetical protein